MLVSITPSILPAGRACRAIDRARSLALIAALAGIVGAVPTVLAEPAGAVIRDCSGCPELVPIPPGSFVMGSPDGEAGRALNETQLPVSFALPFAAGRFAVTFAEWDMCVAGGGCGGYHPEDDGHGRDRRPVVNVSWADAMSYVEWLTAKTGKSYRLLSESEREYVTRAGRTTPFWWGDAADTARANIDVPVRANATASAEARRASVDVDAFAPNPWGLYNVHGNVWEWTADCWTDDNTLHPPDGRPLLDADCSRRPARGGSWNDFAAEARAATRFGFDAASRNGLQGFRVARDLP